MTQIKADEPRLYFFYKLVCNDTNVKDFYVGSTVNWIKRKYKHKQSVTNKNHPDYNNLKAKTIRANGGWENWSMLEIERDIYIKRMATAHEYDLMAKLNSTMNTQKCFGSNSKCQHGIIKQICKQCGGSQICEHDKLKQYCKQCGGSQICIHNKQKQYCKECNGSTTCEHDYANKRFCPYCCPYLCECGTWTTEGDLKQHYKSKHCRDFHIKEYGKPAC